METPKTNNRPKKIEDMSKEQLRQAIIKKRECNAKAQTIVESLLEKDISDDYLLQCLPNLNQSHFEDVIEERSIIHLCGYPICNNTLSFINIPKQKYHISLRFNKVYDITVRKHFCSNTCYKAAMHVKNQMLTSPLWFRDNEEIPKFNLISTDGVGCLGQEINVALVEKIDIKPEQFTSINDFANVSLNDMPNILIRCNQKQRDIKNKNKDDDQVLDNCLKNELGNDKKNNGTKISTIKTVTEFEKNEKIKLQEKIKPNPLNIVGEIIEKPENKIYPISSMNQMNTSQLHKPVIKSRQPNKLMLVIEVEKCLAEWFTLDTMLLLFGEEKVKEMVADKGECIKEYLNNYANNHFYSPRSYDKYQALCRKLNMLELQDRYYDAQKLNYESKPLPDYSTLQKESKKIELKVKAFFAGETTTKEENTEVEMDDENLRRLPLVDKNAQNLLRRKIVCDQLNKVLPDLLRSLGVTILSISLDVRQLVSTFHLKANNIIFKPIQWTLIAIVIIKLVSLKDQRLENLLQQHTAFQQMQLLLLSYKQDGGYLDRLVSWLIDIDRLLNTNDTQLTIRHNTVYFNI